MRSGAESRARGNPREDNEVCDLPSADPFFDQWLRHHLGKLYDPVMREPLPREFIRLLSESKPK